MSNQKISQFVTVSYKGSLLLPAVDMSLPIGTQNVNILASTLGGTTINGKAPLGITATDTAMISPTTSTANVVVTIGDVDTTLSISNGSYDMQSLAVRIDQGTTPHDVSFDSGIALGTDGLSCILLECCDIKMAFARRAAGVLTNSLSAVSPTSR